MDSGSSDAPSTSKELNAPTRLPANAGAPRIAASVLKDRFALASERMAEAKAAATGYRFFWVHDETVRWIDLPVGSSFAIIGRHTNCDVVLDDPEISLRHLLATTIALSDGIALRLIDLQTDVPLYLHDETPRRSIVACGPVAARLGRYVIGGAPIERAGAGEEPRVRRSEFVPPIIEESPALPVSVNPLRPAIGSSPNDERHGPPSRITIMPPSAPIVTLAPDRTKSSRLDPNAPLAIAPVYGDRARVTLHRAGRSASVELTDPELEAGVLIGRSHRCLDAGLHAVLDTNISRGHLLLLKHHGGVEAFDLCSTQGTFQRERAVRRIALSDDHVSLRLAVTNAVTFEWHPRKSAS